MMLDTEENDMKMKAGIFSGDDSINLDSISKIIKAFSKEGKVSFYIEEKDNPLTNYKFTIKTGNLSEMYDKWNKK